MIDLVGFLVPSERTREARYVLTVCAWMLSPMCFAQQVTAEGATATVAEATGGVTATVPTRILAIGHLSANATGSVLRPVLAREVSDTLRLYLSGKIDQWYFKPDDNAVVFILNVTDIQQAHNLLAQLPLGRAGLMEFELIRLAPLEPLGMLLPKASQ
jgi:hypothetical protein